MSEAGREWAWAAAWAGLILVATTIPLPEPPGTTAVPLDKVAHGMMYAGLGGLLARALRRTGHWGAARVTWVLLGGLAFAALDEGHQHWLATRVPSVGDWVADGIGLLAGVATVALVAAIRGERGNGAGREAYPSPHGGGEPPGMDREQGAGGEDAAGGSGGTG